MISADEPHDVHAGALPWSTMHMSGMRHDWTLATPAQLTLARDHLHVLSDLPQCPRGCRILCLVGQWDGGRPASRGGEHHRRAQPHRV
jgi:hypothetical protein